MHNVVLSPITPKELIDQISEQVTANIMQALKTDLAQADNTPDDPLNDFIEKKEVAGKIASASTLWKWEKAGKIQSYGIGGKRFYKRSELMESFTKMNKKELQDGK